MQPLTQDRQGVPDAAPRALGRLWGVPLAFGLFFVVIALWALATPLFASPDEPSHVYRAYGVAHGHVYANPTAAMNGSGGFVDVPVGLTRSSDTTGCYAFKPSITAKCLRSASYNDRLVPTASGAARYNPVYYFVVGLPSLVVSNRHMVLAMRLVSAALSALMLAWAVTAVARLRRPRLAVATVVFGITPMVLFLGASVNPNGLEITSAAAVWAGLLVLLAHPDSPHAPMLLRRTAVAASVLVLMRGLSPLWLAVIVVLCAVTARRDARQLLTRRSAPWFGLVVVSGVASVLWTLLSKSLVISQLGVPTHYGLWHRITLSWDQEFDDWKQQVGVFGWLDTRLPDWAYHSWLWVGGIVLLLALVAGSWRLRLLLVGTLATTLVLPVLIQAEAWNTSGPVWQGRYTMPISIGLVVASAVAFGRAPVMPRVPAWIVSVALVAAGVGLNAYAFMWALYRYSTGIGRPFSITGEWEPPLGSWTLTAGQFVAGLAGAAAVLAVRRRASATGVPDPVRDDEPVPAGQ